MGQDETQRARKLKKVHAKKPWNCIFGSFKLFPSSKIDFWSFLKLQNVELAQKNFREIDLFDFTSFFGLDFFKFSGPLCVYKLLYIDFPPKKITYCVFRTTSTAG